VEDLRGWFDLGVYEDGVCFVLYLAVGVGVGI